MGSIALVLSCSSRERCLELAEFILNYRGVKGEFIEYSVEEGKLRVWINGPLTEVTTTKRTVLKAYREWKSIKAWHEGSGVIDLGVLMRMVGKPFITEALVELLKLSGFKAEVKGDLLESNAPPYKILRLASELANALEDLVKYKPRASHTAKALITSYAVVRGIRASEALQELQELGAISVEGFRVLVRSEWRSLLRRLVSSDVGKELGGSS